LLDRKSVPQGLNILKSKHKYSPGCKDALIPFVEGGDVIDRIREASKGAIDICAAAHGGNGAFRGAHSPGVLRYLEEVLGRKLPNPNYAREASKEVPSHVEQVAGDLALESHPFADELAEESVILGRGDLSPTQKESLIRARRGQGRYRQDLERVEIGCRLTGIVDRRHLRASHIKPWSVSNDQEKLDPNNGLLLSPHVYHLFDRGYISFTDEGELLVSKALNPVVLSAWGLKGADSKKAFSEKQCLYLAYHRESVFEKHGRSKEFDEGGPSAAEDASVHFVLREIVPGSG
jgi:hypothetical protein